MSYPKIDIPDASGVRFYFGDVGELNSIVGRAAWSELPDLRMVLLPQGDEEVRVWGGFVLEAMQGMVLRKRNGEWGALRLLPAPPAAARWSIARSYPGPIGGWPAFWDQMERLGLWTLPDDSTLPQESRGTHLDGHAYTVELQREGLYRAYHYSNPNWERWPEARRMVEIVDMLEAEFPR